MRPMLHYEKTYGDAFVRIDIPLTEEEIEFYRNLILSETGMRMHDYDVKQVAIMAGIPCDEDDY